MTRISLSSTFEIFGAAVGVLALLVGLPAWRTRPRPAPPRASRGGP